MGYSSWGRKELDTTERHSLTRLSPIKVGREEKKRNALFMGICDMMV